MTSDPKEALERLKESLADLQSHRSSWRNALEIALRHADAPGVDHDDPSYWRHELTVFDRVFEQVPNFITKQEGLATDRERLRQLVAMFRETDTPGIPDETPLFDIDPSITKPTFGDLRELLRLSEAL